MRRLSRRGFVRGVGLAAAGAASPLAPATPAWAAEPRRFSRVVDLTHALGPDFPTFGGGSGLALERLAALDEDGFNMHRWLLVEHTGTHMDAPSHFAADGRPADEIPVEELVVPLVVVDIARKAVDDPDAQLTPDDLRAFEAGHGPIPAGACVALHSGWDRRVATAGFRNADAGGVMHFPGFHVEAAELLLERGAAGIAVDTLSLDHGRSSDFATHYRWLPGNRWGLEAVANLVEAPAVGATLMVGGPKIRGATGRPEPGAGPAVGARRRRRRAADRAGESPAAGWRRATARMDSAPHRTIPRSEGGRSTPRTGCERRRMRNMPNGPRAKPAMRGMMVTRAGALLLLSYAFAAGSGGPAVSLAGGSRVAGPQVGGGCPAGGTAEPRPLDFPPLTGRVVDRAGLLARPEEAELEGLLARHERATTNQVVAVTLETLQGVPIEAYGCRLGNH